MIGRAEPVCDSERDLRIERHFSQIIFVLVLYFATAFLCAAVQAMPDARGPVSALWRRGRVSGVGCGRRSSPYLARRVADV